MENSQTTNVLIPNEHLYLIFQIRQKSSHYVHADKFSGSFQSSFRLGSCYLCTFPFNLHHSAVESLFRSELEQRSEGNGWFRLIQFAECHHQQFSTLPGGLRKHEMQPGISVVTTFECTLCGMQFLENLLTIPKINISPESNSVRYPLITDNSSHNWCPPSQKYPLERINSEHVRRTFPKCPIIWHFNSSL